MKKTKRTAVLRLTCTITIISSMMILDYLLGYLGGTSELCNIHHFSGQVTLVLLTILSLIMAISVGQIITGNKVGRSSKMSVIFAGVLFCVIYYGYANHVCGIHAHSQDQPVA